jgi:hypothetical protein
VERLDLCNVSAGWRTVAPMFTRRSNFGVAVANGRIVVTGGYEHPLTTTK